ncbi:hypothetical protein BJ508DRAFT_300306 [Ascobolus immersus RN42]|uniref:Uncharacterized protein n=1 Tax=Ascobolus immersus RN42 TaxID=1160509 RepID=A0A3N4IUJ4_ASCIM|nr:hypothetical protein BJ508DRAFT_300306 [Ascobolus immersus RN42]
MPRRTASVVHELQQAFELFHYRTFADNRGVRVPFKYNAQSRQEDPLRPQTVICLRNLRRFTYLSTCNTTCNDELRDAIRTSFDHSQLALAMLPESRSYHTHNGDDVSTRGEKVSPDGSATMPRAFALTVVPPSGRERGRSKLAYESYANTAV